MPSASHVSNESDAAAITLQLNQAELLGMTAAQLPPGGCTHQQFIDRPVVSVPSGIDPNDYRFAYVANAAFADLTKWFDFNRPPPHAQRIETTSTSIAFDQFGNALGGVRTAFVDVPTASCTAFRASTQDALYPNHFEYVGKLLFASSRDVSSGFPAWPRCSVRSAESTQCRRSVAGAVEPGSMHARACSPTEPIQAKRAVGKHFNFRRIGPLEAHGCRRSWRISFSTPRS